MIILPKTTEETSRYLPHSGSMCLIDEVVSIDELNINARTRSHQDKHNPLKFGDNLPAVSGIEYAAQTVALHLALIKNDNNTNDNNQALGFLAAVQNCVMHSCDLDKMTCPLDINCTQVYLDSQGGALYEFNLSAELNDILSGRLLIMFKPDLT